MPQKFVDDIVAPCIVDTLILSRASTNTVTVQDIERVVQNWGELKDKVDINECVDSLVQSGHLRKEGNGFRCTDDGRQDVQKVMPWFDRLRQNVQATPGTTR